MTSAMSAGCSSASSANASTKFRRETQGDEVDVLPGHEVAALLRQAARDEPEAEAPRQRRGARVDAGDHQAVLVRRQHDVLHTDERAAAHVEHLVVEQRIDERELVRPQRSRLDRLERDAEQQALTVHVDLAHLRPGGRELAALVAVDEEGRDDRRVRRGARDHVRELADHLAGDVEDLHPVELGEGKGPGDLVHEGAHVLSRMRVPAEDTHGHERPSIADRRTCRTNDGAHSPLVRYALAVILPIHRPRRRTRSLCKRQTPARAVCSSGSSSSNSGIRR